MCCLTTSPASVAAVALAASPTKAEAKSDDDVKVDDSGVDNASKKSARTIQHTHTHHHAKPAPTPAPAFFQKLFGIKLKPNTR